jgi:CheY-like chemotaxis protein
VFHSLEHPERYLHFTVTDTGCGMSPQTVGQIFEPLFTTKKSGTGLGLSVTHQVVQRHGGEVIVESALGAGTSFHIFVPLGEEPEIVIGEAGGELPSIAVMSASPRALNLLLVEDDAAVAAGLELVIAMEGFHVEVARTGAEAIAAVRERRPDAVILDIGLPDMEGTAVYSQIAELHPDLPVIFSTGHADRTRLDEISDGPVFYLLKPYGTETLMAILAKALDMEARALTA